MKYNIIVADSFKKEFKHLYKKHRSLKTDVEELITSLEENPLQGTSLGRNCYKIRMSVSSKGKGKSGGARVITCVKIVSTLVVLLSIYDKSEKEDISDKELELILMGISN